MILIHSHLSTTETLPVRYCCPALDNIVQACPNWTWLVVLRELWEVLHTWLWCSCFFSFGLVFFKLVLRLRLCWLHEARSKASLDWSLTRLVTTNNIWARKPSSVCNERMARAILKCKGLECFVCQPEFKKKLVGKGGNEVGSVFHVIPKIAECLLLSAWDGSCSSKIPALDLKVDEVFGMLKVKDLATDFIFLPSDSKAET